MTRLDGIAVASVDPTNRSLNNSAKDAEQLIALLSTAQSSAVYISNSAPQGIQMAVPLHTAQGEPIGALVGVIDLTKPNFLDTIAKSKYGSSGSYRLYSPSQRRVVMATNLTANTATVGSETPNPNNSLMMNPPEGTSIGADPSGVEALVSTKRIHGGPNTHGNTKHRKPGSIGAGTDPSRVIKGKKMPGQYGNVRHTAIGIRIEKIDAERNLIYLRGSVAGPTNGIVFVRKQS